MMGSPFRMNQALPVCLWCPYLDVDGPLIETLLRPFIERYLGRHDGQNLIFTGGPCDRGKQSTMTGMKGLWGFIWPALGSGVLACCGPLAPRSCYRSGRRPREYS